MARHLTGFIRCRLPAICLFGLVTSSMNIIVLSRKSARDVELLKHYLIISIADFGFLLVEFPIFSFRCGYLCSWGYTMGAKTFELYIYLMVGYMFTTVGVLVDITVAYNRLRVFYAKRAVTLVTNSSIKPKCLICILISIILNIPENGILKEGNFTCF